MAETMEPAVLIYGRWYDLRKLANLCADPFSRGEDPPPNSFASLVRDFAKIKLQQNHPIAFVRADTAMHPQTEDGQNA